MLTMWPEEVRGDLRAGLRAKARGDLKLSQRHLMRCEALFVLMTTVLCLWKEILKSMADSSDTINIETRA